MPTFEDLVRTARVSPEGFRQIMSDERRLGEFNLTSSQLETMRTLTPEQVRVIIDGLEERVRFTTTGTNACPGTNACVEQ